MKLIKTQARWLWQQSIWKHAAALFVVLLCGLLLTRPFVAYSSDEGAALLQARQLASGMGWLYQSPISSIDPEDQARPFVRGDKGTKGVAPYAKHPLYPVVLAVADRVGGQVGIGILGVAATTFAAAFGALLVRRCHPNPGRTVLWLVGLGTPLFFDTYMVLAHGLAAAFGALALVLVLEQVYSERSSVVLDGALVVVLAIAVMLRTEAIFLGPAIVGSLVIYGLSKRLRWKVVASISLAVVIGSLGAIGLERLWSRSIIGKAMPGVPSDRASSWIEGRMDATLLTWFKPSMGRLDSNDFLLLIAVVALAVAGYSLRKGSKNAHRVVVLLGIATLSYVLHLIVVPIDRIPGLVVAFPAGWFLAWTLGRDGWRYVEAAVLLPVFAIASIAVLLTQYDIGGGVEWGGRYFAFLLPIIAAGLVIPAAPKIVDLGSEMSRVVMGALVVISLATTSMSLLLLRDAHLATEGILDRIAVASEVAGSENESGLPVVVSDNRLLPQIAYRDFDDYVWVVPARQHLSDYVARLPALGIDQVVLAVADASSVVAELPGWTVVDRVPGAPLDIVVIRADGS